MSPWIKIGALLAIAFFVAYIKPCWFGLHRWDSPGGNCEDCGIHDDFFDRRG